MRAVVGTAGSSLTQGPATFVAGPFHAPIVPRRTPLLHYHTRDDIPFQFALAESFTICDNCEDQGRTASDQA